MVMCCSVNRGPQFDTNDLNKLNGQEKKHDEVAADHPRYDPRRVCLLHALPSARRNQQAETRRHSGSRDVGRRAPGENSRVETRNLISLLLPPAYQSLHSTKRLINTSSRRTRRRFHGNGETKQVLQGQGAPGARRRLRLRCYWTFHHTHARAHAHARPSPPRAPALT